MAGFTERRWETRDGLTLYARDYPAEGGEKGVPVLCLHGFSRNSRDFEDLAPVIAAQGRRVIAMDMRGRGQSDRDSKPGNYHPRSMRGTCSAAWMGLGLRARFSSARRWAGSSP